MSTEATEALLHENLEQLTRENVILQEDLEQVKQQYYLLQLEDRGWKSLFGPDQFSEDTGLELKTLKSVSKSLRESVAGSAYPKRANELRQAYTFGKRFVIPGVTQGTDGAKKRGRKSKAQAFWDHKYNQRYTFGKLGQTELHSASSTDGMVIWLGDNATKTGRPIPLSEIEGVYLNPDFADEVWGYLRSWGRYNAATGQVDTIRVWYMTDMFPESKKVPATLGVDGDQVPVSRSHTVIDLKFNGQIGWTYGVPDLMAGTVWNKKYLTMVKHGELVSETLALYAAKVKQKSRSGAQNVGFQVTKPGQRAGSTVAYGDDNEVSTFSTAGRTYDFGGLRIFAAFYAAAVGVPLTDLTADPGAAGSSYGSAAALLPAARRTMEDRRDVWAAWYSRLFEWGTGEVVRVMPESIQESDPYRDMQKLTLAWQSGLVWPDEARRHYLELSGITALHAAAPPDVKVPNSQSDEPEPVAEQPGVQAASPDQGKSNNTGGADGKDKQDLVNDNQTE